MSAIAYVVVVAGVVRRGVSSGTDSHEQQARAVRARHYLAAGLDNLPPIAWCPTEPYRGEIDAAELPDPRK
jgi:hypothetical protein